MENKKYVIITGGAGFIGSHTYISLLENKYTPVIIDDFRNSRTFIIDRLKQISEQNVILENYDCGDYELLKSTFLKYQPSGVIHFSADKAVGESIKEPLKYYENNLGSLINVLKVCKETKVSNIVLSSSCTVYGEPEIIPVTEQTPIGYTPSPYGYTKQVAERICTDFAVANPEFSITMLRYFNPIGAHPSGLIGELPIGVPKNLIPYVTQTAFGLRKELTINGSDYDTIDGTCVRDYIHVCDLAEVHVLAIKNMIDHPKPIYIYNVGTGIGSSILEVIKGFEEVNELKLPYKLGPRRNGDVVSIYADNTKITKELNWKPKYTLKDALAHAWQWQQNIPNEDV